GPSLASRPRRGCCRATARDRLSASSCCDPFQCISREHEFDTEFVRHPPVVPTIERHDGVSPAVDRRIEYHVVVRVPQSAAPQEMCLDFFDQSRKSIEKKPGLRAAQAGGLPMLGALADGFVL